MELHRALIDLLSIVAPFIMLSFLAIWLIGLVLRDSSIVDMWFAPCIAIAASIGYLLGAGAESRRLLVMLLAIAWAARLGGYLIWRNWGREDRRYARLRQHIESQGKSYALHSLIHVNLQQGVMVVIIVTPFLFAQASTFPSELGLFGYAGAALVIFGIVFEAIADRQLMRFRIDPGNAGRVLDRGLWRYSRHPNYFGECCVWVGFGVIAAEVPWGWVGFLSPAVMAWGILGMMGKELVERRMLKKRPDYEDYVRRTSGFFPLPPRTP